MKRRRCDSTHGNGWGIKKTVSLNDSRWVEHKQLMRHAIFYEIPKSS